MVRYFTSHLFSSFSIIIVIRLFNICCCLSPLMRMEKPHEDKDIAYCYTRPGQREPGGGPAMGVKPE